MVAFKLALRNLMGAGLRTWLNVIVLSFSFVVIIWQQGLLDGWDQQARRDTIEWEVGGGQYWHELYDPYDPFSIEDGQGPVPAPLAELIEQGEAAAILVSQATIYPEGRIRSVLLRGIDPAQSVLKIPSSELDMTIEEIPAIIGTRMSKSTQLEVGDYVTVRWRDTHGMFDAAEIKITGIMKTNVGTVDAGQIWVPLDRLRAMMQTPENATLVVVDRTASSETAVSGWTFRNLDFLLKDIAELIKSKKAGGSILYFLLLSLAWLAIFDTQILSIFRRRKEIGTFVALGMTRSRVVRLFTIEGAMHGLMAALLAAVYGTPLLALQAAKGWAMPEMTGEMGLAIAEKIFPVYGFGLVVGTTILVLLSVTIVSFIPARKISKMNPTDAIKGKVT